MDPQFQKVIYSILNLTILFILLSILIVVIFAFFDSLKRTNSPISLKSLFSEQEKKVENDKINPVKKKRGRPPKNKEENISSRIIEIGTSASSGKKRGRPPKKDTISPKRGRPKKENSTKKITGINEIEKISHSTKKRGRPPKNQSNEKRKRGRPPKNKR